MEFPEKKIIYNINCTEVVNWASNNLFASSPFVCEPFLIYLQSFFIPQFCGQSTCSNLKLQFACHMHDELEGYIHMQPEQGKKLIYAYSEPVFLYLCTLQNRTLREKIAVEKTKRYGPHNFDYFHPDWNSSRGHEHVSPTGENKQSSYFLF